jgi:hypothetical protein
MGDDLLLQRRGDAECGLADAVQLVEPVILNPAVVGLREWRESLEQ